MAATSLFVRSLKLKNFTCLPDGEYDLVQGINVVLGENGTGKTHLLKLIYTILRVGYEVKSPSQQRYASRYAEKLIAVFRPDSLGRLVRRGVGRQRCEVALSFTDPVHDVGFSFSSLAETEVQVAEAPRKVLPVSPAYFSVRETISLVPWFDALYRERAVPFEETWVDTTTLLAVPPLRGPKEKAITELLEPLTEVLGGTLRTDPQTGRFYLYQKGGGIFEMPLLAEGLRKIAMVARLVQNGTLLDQGFLFWDEPEANLNPKLIRVLAHFLVSLARQKVQLFIVTHSLFFLRELYMLLNKEPNKDISQKWFGLVRDREGAVQLEVGNTVDDLTTIVALEEEVRQSGAYLQMEIERSSTEVQAQNE